MDNNSITLRKFNENDIDNIFAAEITAYEEFATEVKREICVE